MKTSQLSVPHGRKLSVFFVFALTCGFIGPNAANIFSSHVATMNGDRNPDGSVEQLEVLESKVAELERINTQQAEAIQALAVLVNSFYRENTISCSKILLTSNNGVDPTIVQKGPHHGLEVITSNENADRLALISEKSGNGLRLSFWNPKEKPQESPIMFSSEARTNRYGEK